MTVVSQTPRQQSHPCSSQLTNNQTCGNSYAIATGPVQARDDAMATEVRSHLKLELYHSAFSAKVTALLGRLLTSRIPLTGPLYTPSDDKVLPSANYCR